MSDWLLNLPVPWMAFVVFVARYLAAGSIYLVVTGLAVAMSPLHFGDTQRGVKNSRL